MLREEQIDIRRQRAVEGNFKIQNLGRNRVFSDFQVTNPISKGVYRVGIRGFEVGDNTCACPDFRTNTLGTCKHIEAVLATLRAETPAQLQTKKAPVTRPEVFLHYGERLRIGLHLPQRNSDQLTALAHRYFDVKGMFIDAHRFDDLIDALDHVPEQVTIFSDAMEFMEREMERREMSAREREQLDRLNRGELDLNLLTVPLYPYQIRGALFAAYRGRCILGDDMGLGKTVQTLAAVEIIVREREIERVLVVAPASVKYQWESEIRKFTTRSVQVIEGGNKARHDQYRQPTFYRLINYELVVRDLDELNAWQPDLIVLDEAQRIKNWEAKTSKAVKKLRSRWALVLTGTPLENKLEELYSIVQFVDDRRLGPPFQFLHDHRVLDDKGKLLGYRNLDRLREKLEPIFLRRTRKEVLGQLPARTDNIIYVEMTPEQRLPYAEEQQTLARLVHKKYLTEMDRRRVLCCLANMRMLCDSTFLYDKQSNVSPKLEEFAELMCELVQEGKHRVVVFSQWEVMLQKAQEVLTTLQIGHVFLHGKVPGPERRELMERFERDPDCSVFLSTDAGGVGLNLQKADTVINLELPWNPAVLEQRIGRVHRLGQHRPVQVIHLITRNSIEERVLKTVEAKRSLFEGVFAGTTNEVMFESLGGGTFLQTVKELLGSPAGVEAGTAGGVLREREGGVTASQVTAVSGSSTVDPQLLLVQSAIQFLEALSKLVGETPDGEGSTDTRVVSSLFTTDARGRPVIQIPLPTAEWQERGRKALQQLAKSLGERTPNPPAPSPAC